MLTNSPLLSLYRLAGQDILFDPAIPEIRQFKLETQSFLPILPNLPHMDTHGPPLQAKGLIADRLETISLWRNEHGLLLEIPSVGRFWTSAEGSAIRHVSGLPDLVPSVLAQSLLGPPLVLALALCAVWCLHASAICVGDK